MLVSKILTKHHIYKLYYVRSKLNLFYLIFKTLIIDVILCPEIAIYKTSVYITLKRKFIDQINIKAVITTGGLF